MQRPLAVLVLAAGKGSRTKVDLPKVLLPLCGRTLLGSVLDAVATLEPAKTVAVLGHQKERVAATLPQVKGLVTVDQGNPKGTGHAAQVAVGEALQDFDGDVMVVYGDVPLIRGETLQALRDAKEGAAAALLTVEAANPAGLGRILRSSDGEFVGIREDKDCTDDEREIDEVNPGFYCFDSKHLAPALDRLSSDNAQNEYYLTDVLGDFIRQGLVVATVEADDEEELQGVNNLPELSLARAAMQERILLGHLMQGVIVEDPATTFIDAGVAIGAGTRVLPCTVIRSGVSIGQNCEVGPFTHLRVGTVLEDGAELGNFVETKKAHMGRGSKAKHLTYLGDVKVGESVNIGCGTITANYDGVNKHQTVIGDHAFVGSGTVLVAPTEMGSGSMTGAGAIVRPGTKIGEDEAWVGVPARSLGERKIKAKTKKKAVADGGKR